MQDLTEHLIWLAVTEAIGNSWFLQAFLLALHLSPLYLTESISGSRKCLDVWELPCSKYVWLAQWWRAKEGQADTRSTRCPFVIPFAGWGCPSSSCRDKDMAVTPSQGQGADKPDSHVFPKNTHFLTQLWLSARQHTLLPSATLRFLLPLALLSCRTQILQPFLLPSEGGGSCWTKPSTAYSSAFYLAFEDAA